MPLRSVNEFQIKSQFKTLTSLQSNITSNALLRVTAHLCSRPMEIDTASVVSLQFICELKNQMV